MGACVIAIWGWDEQRQRDSTPAPSTRAAGRSSRPTERTSACSTSTTGLARSTSRASNYTPVVRAAASAPAWSAPSSIRPAERPGPGPRRIHGQPPRSGPLPAARPEGGSQARPRQHQDHYAGQPGCARKGVSHLIHGLSKLLPNGSRVRSGR